MSNDTLNAGLVLFVCGLLFLLLFGPILGVGGLFSFNPDFAFIGFILMWAGIIFIPIGFILIIIGAVTSPKVQYVYTQNLPNRQYSFQQPVQQQQFYCREFGTPCNRYMRFCTNC